VSGNYSTWYKMPNIGTWHDGYTSLGFAEGHAESAHYEESSLTFMDFDDEHWDLSR